MLRDPVEDMSTSLVITTGWLEVQPCDEGSRANQSEQKRSGRYLVDSLTVMSGEWITRLEFFFLVSSRPALIASSWVS